MYKKTKDELELHLDRTSDVKLWQCVTVFFFYHSRISKQNKSSKN